MHAYLMFSWQVNSHWVCILTLSWLLTHCLRLSWLPTHCLMLSWLLTH